MKAGTGAGGAKSGIAQYGAAGPLASYENAQGGQLRLAKETRAVKLHWPAAVRVAVVPSVKAMKPEVVVVTEAAAEQLQSGTAGSTGARLAIVPFPVTMSDCQHLFSHELGTWHSHVSTRVRFSTR